MPVPYITEHEVRELLSMPECIEAMRSAFVTYAAGEAQNQPRRRLILKTGAVLHSLAGAYGSYFGTKIYSTHPKHGAHFFFLLFDAETGAALAEFEANHLGQIRTGAASGLAVDLLAPKRPVSVGVIGSGFQAQSQIDAVRAVREIKTLRIWSRRPEKRVGCETAQQAIEGADVAITATSAKDPVLEAAWVAPDAIVCAMGSNQAQRRELPADLVRNAALLIADDTEQAKIEAGDYIMALDEAGWRRVMPLADIVAGKLRAPEHGIRIFKSIGLGLEDVAAASVVYEKVGAEHARPPDHQK